MIFAFTSLDPLLPAWDEDVVDAVGRTQSRADARFASSTCARPSSPMDRGGPVEISPERLRVAPAWRSGRPSWGLPTSDDLAEGGGTLRRVRARRAATSELLRLHAPLIARRTLACSPSNAIEVRVDEVEGEPSGASWHGALRTAAASIAVQPRCTSTSTPRGARRAACKPPPDPRPDLLRSALADEDERRASVRRPELVRRRGGAPALETSPRSPSCSEVELVLDHLATYVAAAIGRGSRGARPPGRARPTCSKCRDGSRRRRALDGDPLARALRLRDRGRREARASAQVRRLAGDARARRALPVRGRPGAEARGRARNTTVHGRGCRGHHLAPAATTSAFVSPLRRLSLAAPANSVAREHRRQRERDCAPIVLSHAASLSFVSARRADLPSRASGREYSLMRCFATRRRSTSRAAPGATAASRFRREAHVPRGGPDGGDGGHGGDVVLVCDPSRRDLASLRFSPHHRAGRGRPRAGQTAPRGPRRRRLILVPPGTQATGLDGERYDLVEPGQRAIVARGGLGGHGNKRFANSTRQAPRFAERGITGESGWIELRLKLLADAGLVGLPNAGKSSLLGAADAGGPEGRRLPVHDARAGPRHARRRRAPARPRRHPGADRGRRRGRGARPRVPRPRRALPDARPRRRDRRHDGGARPVRALRDGPR